MISGHLQTPDLSDHSGDEAKLTKPSGLELKTNELWSSDLEEELESRIMQPATFSSILKQFPSILEETIISKIMSNKNCDKTIGRRKYIVTGIFTATERRTRCWQHEVASGKA